MVIPMTSASPSDALSLDTICLDPALPTYRYRRAHQEDHRGFTGVITLHPAEEAYFTRKGFMAIYAPSLDGVSGVPPLSGLQAVRQPYPHVLLGPYSEHLGGLSELRVRLAEGHEMVHGTHWHPRKVPSQQLITRIKLDVLAQVRAWADSDHVPLLVLDGEWMPVIHGLREAYGCLQEYALAGMPR